MAVEVLSERIVCAAAEKFADEKFAAAAARSALDSVALRSLQLYPAFHHSQGTNSYTHTQHTARTTVGCVIFGLLLRTMRRILRVVCSLFAAAA